MKTFTSFMCTIMFMQISFSTNSYTQWYLPIVSEYTNQLLLRPTNNNEMYISNTVTHILYDFQLEQTIKTFVTGPSYTCGTLSPVFFYSAYDSYTAVSIENSSISLFKENANDYSENITYTKFFNIIWYDTLSVWYTILDGTVCHAVVFDTRNNEEKWNASFPNCSRIQVYLLQDNQWLAIEKTDTNSFNYHFLRYSDLDKTTTNTFNPDYSEQIANMDIVELDDNIILGCFLNNSLDKVSCFSATYDTDTFQVYKTSKVMIDNCATPNPNEVFILVSYIDKFAAVSCGSNPLKIQFFSNDIEPTGEWIIFNDNNFWFYEFTIMKSNMILITGIKSTLTSQDNGHYYTAFIYGFDKCPNIKIVAGSNENVYLSMYFAYTTSLLYFTEITSSTDFVFSQDGPVELEKDYNNPNIYLTPKTITSDTNIKFFIYNIDINGYRQLSDGPCWMNLYNCYTSCLSCSQGGTDDNHNCNSCKSGFYPLQSNNKNCYDNDTKPVNTFLENNVYKDCDSICSGCTGTASQCSDCANGYAMVFTNQGQCLEYNDIPNGMYWTEDNKFFKPCFNWCESCLGEGDNTNHNCDTCVNGYYSAESLWGMCYNSSPGDDYYFDSTTNKYRLCDSKCQSCTGNNQCSSCKSDFYFYNDFCYTILEKPENTYADEADKTFKLCHTTCKTCGNGLVNNTQNCLSCQDPLFLLDNTNCVATVPDNYYNDNTDGIYKECDTKCKKCSESATKCSECNDWFYWIATLFQCWAIENKPNDYYVSADGKEFLPCFNLCETCDIGGDNTNNNCKSCVTNYHFVEGNAYDGNCFSTPPDENYYLDSTDNTYKLCYSTCKTCNESGNITTHNCATCIDGYDFIANPDHNCEQSSVTQDDYDCIDFETTIKDNETYDIHFSNNADYFTPWWSPDPLVHNIIFTSDPSGSFNGKIITPNLNDEIQWNTNYNIFSFVYVPSSANDVSIINYSLVKPDSTAISSVCSLTFITCDHNCKTCSLGNPCWTCIDNYYIIKETSPNECVRDCNGMYYHNGLMQCFSSCPNWTYQNECVDQCPGTTSVDPSNNHCVGDWITPCDNNEDCFQSSETKEEMVINLDKNIIFYKDVNSKIQGDDYIWEVYYSNSTFDNTDTSSINFGECEILLRRYYKIPDDEPLIIAKIDIESKYAVTNKVEYNVYNILGQRLNWGYCANISIEINYPITNTTDWDIEQAKLFLNQGVDVFDSTDSFFNELCYPYSEDGKDMVIKDRREDIYQNVSFCEDGCEYAGVNYTTMKAKCICNIKDEIISDSETEQRINLNAFTSSLSSINFVVVKCYRLVLEWENWKYNVGFWFILGIIGWHIFILMFCQYPNFKSFYSKLNKTCQETFLMLPQNNPPVKVKILNTLSNGKTPRANPVKKRKSESSDDIVQETDFSRKNESGRRNQKEKDSKVLKKHTILKSKKEVSYDTELFEGKPKKQFCKVSIYENSEYKTYTTHNSSKCTIRKRSSEDYDEVHFNNTPIKHVSSKFNNNHRLQRTKTTYQPSETLDSRRQKKLHKTYTSNSTMITQNNLVSNMNIRSYSKYQTELTTSNKLNLIDMTVRPYTMNFLTQQEKIDNVIYESAVKEDWRTFWRWFWEYFREKESTINAFCSLSLFEMLSLNICYFFFVISLSFSLNALFYTDDIISQRYNNELTYLTTVLHSIYSYLITSVITRILHSLIIYCPWWDTILKEVKNMERLYFWISKVTKRIKIKIALFYILEILILWAIWFYMTCFCIVYPGSQWEFFKSGWLSFGIDIWTSLAVCLGWSIWRFSALMCKSKNMYNASNYIKQLF